MVDERSAGAILFHLGGVDHEYLLLHYTSGHWDFPKGNIEPGEEEPEAARREIQEETGIKDIEFVNGFRKTIEYRYKRDGMLIHKEVVIYLARTATKDVTLSFEHIGYTWKTYSEAMKQLTFKNAKYLLTDASNYLGRDSSLFGQG